jgi:hypothetical protein
MVKFWSLSDPRSMHYLTPEDRTDGDTTTSVTTYQPSIRRLAKTSKDTGCITTATVNSIPNRHLILKNFLLRHLTFSGELTRLQGYRDDWVVTDVTTDRGAFIFRVKRSKQNDYDPAKRR